MLQQAPKYQKGVNVISHEVTPEYKSIEKILHLIPKAPLLDLASAEGFIVYMANKAGFEDTLGIEIDGKRVERGRTHLGVNLKIGDVFENLDLLKNFDIFVISRFFHNLGHEKSIELMKAINKKKDYLLIIKHKPGPRKETGAKREPLATKKGVNEFLEYFPVEKKSFRGDTIVAGKGKYADVPGMLRKHLKEPS